MNIVSSGGKYMVYGEEVSTYEKLPPYTYEVSFNKMTGYSLIKSEDMEIKEKIYGPYQRKVDKILNTFNLSNRNLGIILSGPKGAGKTMFSRLLAIKAREQGLPLILVNGPLPSLSNFISSIKQECIVLFDEFEKNFPRGESGDESNAQTELLSLFDGLDNGKKLFIITCNQVYLLNQYFLNRPGRFHYHFAFESPSREEIEEYMSDKLNENGKKYLKEIVNLAEIGDFTYDILRAISFELNQGYSLTETLEDLNIEFKTIFNINIKVIFTNGEVAEDMATIDMMEDECRVALDFITSNRPYSYRMKFKPSDLKFSEGRNIILNKKDCTHLPRFRSLAACYDDEDKNFYNFDESLEIQNVIVTQPSDIKKTRSQFWIPQEEDRTPVLRNSKLTF